MARCADLRLEVLAEPAAAKISTPSSPEKQQLILQNVDDVLQARDVARKMSVEALRKVTPSK